VGLEHICCRPADRRIRQASKTLDRTRRCSVKRRLYCDPCIDGALVINGSSCAGQQGGYDEGIGSPWYENAPNNDPTRWVT
jgi:hypothetical protein